MTNHPILSGFREIIEIDFAYFYLNKQRDTLIVRYKKSTTITISMAKTILNTIIPIKKKKAILNLTDATAKFLSIEPEARKFYSDNVTTERMKAHAIVTGDLSTNLQANYFMNFDKPSVPTKVFNEFDKALSWLSNFK